MEEKLSPKAPAVRLPPARTFGEDMKEIVDKVNREPSTQPAVVEPNAPPEYRFVQLTEKTCDALLEAARHQLNIAQNNLAATEQYVEKLRGETKARWDSHEAYVRSLEDFGLSILEANSRFHKNGK